MIKSMLVLCSVVFTFGAFPTSPASAQKAPGNYPACDVDNPPAKCADNMYVEIVAALAPNTGRPVDTSQPGCGPGNTKNLVEQAMDAIKSSSSKDGLASFSGNLFSVLQIPIADAVLKNTGGDVHDFVQRNGPKRKDANCVPVAAFIPASADLVGVRLFVHDIDAAPPQHWGGCAPGQDCSIGFCKYMARPEEVSTDGGTAVVATFANWSHDRRRVGHMYVFYTMPSGQKPVPII